MRLSVGWILNGQRRERVIIPWILSSIRQLSVNEKMRAIPLVAEDGKSR